MGKNLMWWGFYLPPCRKIPIARYLVTIMTISAIFSNMLWRCYKPWEEARWSFRNRRRRGLLRAATGTSLYYLRGCHQLYFHGLLDLDELWGLLPHSWEQRQSLFSFHLRPHFTCSALVSPCTRNAFCFHLPCIMNFESRLSSFFQCCLSLWA